MLRAQLLNSQASLNNYKVLDSISYVPGEDVIIVFQLINDQLDIRYIPNVLGTVEIDILKSDGTKYNASASVVDADDRSIWTVTVDAADSIDLNGFNIEVTLDELNDGTDIKKALIQSALRKQLLSGDC